MTDRRDSRLRRLADAVDIYLEQRAKPHAEVDPVLARNAGLRDLLEPMLKAQTPDSGIEVTRSDRLGDFRMVREIGRGGMGVVYEAEELSLGRRVALQASWPGACEMPVSQDWAREEACLRCSG